MNYIASEPNIGMDKPIPTCYLYILYSARLCLAQHAEQQQNQLFNVLQRLLLGHQLRMHLVQDLQNTHTHTHTLSFTDMCMKRGLESTLFYNHFQEFTFTDHYLNQCNEKNLLNEESPKTEVNIELGKKHWKSADLRQSYFLTYT